MEIYNRQQQRIMAGIRSHGWFWANIWPTAGAELHRLGLVRAEGEGAKRVWVLA